MYLNFPLIASKGLSPDDIIFLAAVKINRTEDNSQYIEKHYTEEQISRFKQASLIEEVKPSKKNDTVYKRLRLTKAGADLLEEITTPVVTQGDIELFKYFSSLYLAADEERKIGNKKKCLQYIAEFRQIMGFSLHECFYLFQAFTEEVVYSKLLERAFIDTKLSPYSKFRDNIEASKIFQYFEDNEEKVRNIWRQKIKTEE